MPNNTVRSLLKNEKGYAVAEFAVTIPILISVVSICFWVIGISITKFQIENYANQAARTVARGESLPQDYLTNAPSGMTMNIDESDSRVRVETKLTTQIPILMKQIELTGSAEILSEKYVFTE